MKIRIIKSYKTTDNRIRITKRDRNGVKYTRIMARKELTSNFGWRKNHIDVDFVFKFVLKSQKFKLNALLKIYLMIAFASCFELQLLHNIVLQYPKNYMYIDFSVCFLL